MSDRERELLHVELAGQHAAYTLRTQTRIDTGRWWRKSRLWLCVASDDLLLFAAHKRRYVQRMPLRACMGSRYCHASGVLLLEPRDDWRFCTIDVSPADAAAVLKRIDNASNPSAPPTSTPTTPPVTEPTGA
ncbi:MAG: hypothetical protein ACPGYV_02705 [Phycisphaeraceae bacterium]